MQPETNTTITTPEPETPQVDPAVEIARESAVDVLVPSQAPVIPSPVAIPDQMIRAQRLFTLRIEHAGQLPYMAHVPQFHFEAPNTRIQPRSGTVSWMSIDFTVELFPDGINGSRVGIMQQDTSSNHLGMVWASGPTPRAAYTAAYRELRLAKYDKAELLRGNARLHADLDMMADKASDLECQVIEHQIAAAKAPTVSTLVTLPTDAAPEPPALLGEITSQVAEAVMHSERAQAIPVSAEWYDEHTLAYLRQGWSQLTPERQEAIAVHLMNEVCQPPRQRNVAWVEIVRAVQMAAGGAS